MADVPGIDPGSQSYHNGEPGGGWLLGAATLPFGGPEEEVLLDVGPFSGDSIAARSTAQTFTASERAAINEIGENTGCHTCGTKDPGTISGNFVPDHQPVSALNNSNAPQRLYPQCINCSRQQGLLIAKILRMKGQ